MEILLMVMAGLGGAPGIMEAGHMTGLTGASGTQPGHGRDETGVDGGHGLLTYQNVTEESARGFYRLGRWVDRARTPEEQRFHDGGQGQQRQSRRQERVRQWKAGTFVPA